MAEIFNNKINVLKALAILIVVAGHLEFALIPMFPPYSFQVLLFFFIAGMLYKPDYSFLNYLKRRAKSLILPYYSYAAFYLLVTFVFSLFVGKFWGLYPTFKNEILMPFLTGHQLDLISPLWFVPSLFISLIVYKILFKIKINDTIKFLIYLIFALLAIQLQSFADNVKFLWLLRTMYALFFIHLGYLYKTKGNSEKLFTPKILCLVLIFQSLLWLTNKDFTPQDGIGLHFLLVWGKYNNPIVPILTSITGIWICLFLVEFSYEKVKNWSFLQKIGQNTYHIMANHLLVFNLITYFLLSVKGIPFDVKNNADIYWFFCPLKTTYFYFVVGIIITTYFGEFLKFLKKRAITLIGK